MGQPGHGPLGPGYHGDGHLQGRGPLGAEPGHPLLHQVPAQGVGARFLRRAQGNALHAHRLAGGHGAGQADAEGVPPAGHVAVGRHPVVGQVDGRLAVRFPGEGAGVAQGEGHGVGLARLHRSWHGVGHVLHAVAHLRHFGLGWLHLHEEAARHLRRRPEPGHALLDQVEVEAVAPRRSGGGHPHGVEGYLLARGHVARQGGAQVGPAAGGPPVGRAPVVAQAHDAPPIGALGHPGLAPRVAHGHAAGDRLAGRHARWQVHGDPLEGQSWTGRLHGHLHQERSAAHLVEPGHQLAHHVQAQGVSSSRFGRHDLDIPQGDRLAGRHVVGQDAPRGALNGAAVGRQPVVTQVYDPLEGLPAGPPGGAAGVLDGDGNGNPAAGLHPLRHLEISPFGPQKRSFGRAGLHLDAVDQEGRPIRREIPIAVHVVHVEAQQIVTRLGWHGDPQVQARLP